MKTQRDEEMLYNQGCQIVGIKNYKKEFCEKFTNIEWNKISNNKGVEIFFKTKQHIEYCQPIATLYDVFKMKYWFSLYNFEKEDIETIDHDKTKLNTPSPTSPHPKKILSICQITRSKEFE